MKLVPSIVSVSDCPETADVGEMLVTVGIGFTTLKAPDNDEVPPPGAPFVTDTVRGPFGADAVIVRRALNCVALVTLRRMTLTSEAQLTEVTPEMNPEPVIVTSTDRPLAPLSGETAVIVGAGFVTVNAPLSVEAAPLDEVFVTETSLAPSVVVAAMEIFALTDVELRYVVDKTVIPVPKLALVVSGTKLLPVSVTSSV